MKIISALPPAVEQRLLPEIMNAGHTIVARAADAGEILHCLETMPIDVLLVHPRLQKLSRPVLQIIEQHGCRILMLLEDPADSDLSVELGFVENYSADLGWQELAELVQPFGNRSTNSSPYAPPAEGVSEASVSALSADWAEENSPYQDLGSYSGAQTISGAVPQVIAVWGAQGSPGRTGVAINLAVELSQQGERVLLIDADTYGASIAANLGLLDESSTLATACRMAALEQLDNEGFDSLMRQQQLGERLWLLSGIMNSKRWPELAEDRLQAVLKLALQAVDTVVIDIGFSLESDEELSSDLLGPKRNAAALAALAQANSVVAVSGSSALALGRFLRGFHRLTELVEPNKVITVLNRAPKDRGRLAEVLQVLQRFAEVQPTVTLPEDTALYGQSELQGRPVTQLSRSNETVKQFEHLAQFLMRRLALA